MSQRQQSADQPPKKSTTTDGVWYTYQGRQARFSETQKKWFTKTEPRHPGRFLKEEDFSEEEEEPQIKQETPEPPKLTFLDNNDLYTDMANTGKEIRIRAPSNFTGDRTKTMKFLQEVTLFL
jgi:hypothetical protein